MCYIIQPVPLEGRVPDPVAVCNHLGEALDLADLLGTEDDAQLLQIIREDDQTGEKTVEKTIAPAGRMWYNGSNTEIKEPATMQTTQRTKKQIGDIIRAARIRANMTQQELGEKIGFSETNAARSIRKWESGLVLPETTKIRPLAALLGLTVDDLIP